MIINSVDADEMLIFVASHVGLQCLILSHFLNAMLKCFFFWNLCYTHTRIEAQI